ncbi:uncharacterized protein Z518_04975 [Rhinocladiella mackenziei CBS 650.93]|uniref:GST N-terminal domain-containing protein n=1 Tax=Rhinocladiella mackenziei CBS 650.93 TaxID=1442369 RepID=A0A0D2IMN1_9EURO|nr:uncharacterized protein Z518_04975 [Rhinocladiella mackenziei CBS 650.93]KIX06999.1 hypothetical protein Z518_04975 [Rhinocladiella mackenziei CBS 650.93]
MTQNGSGSPQYELYYNPFSICSLMVLLTLRLKGDPKSLSDAVEPAEKEIDIYTGEQMTEEFLEKNWKGQVPVLLSPSLSVQLTDSLDITNYLGEKYPGLAPSAHKETIKALLDELHNVKYITLSFKAEERRAEAIINAIQTLVAEPTSSEKYKAALNKKLQYLLNTYGANPHSPEETAKEENKSRIYLGKISKIIVSNGGKPSSDGRVWIFGEATGPTALDAHTIVFIARLLDAGRANLIGDDMLQWGKKHLESKEWQGIVQGRPTLHNLWEKQQKEKA